MAVNCQKLSVNDIQMILLKVLYEFPVSSIEFFIPKWIEQAAKEMGNQYTNKQEITGAGGGPIQNENTVVVTATDEQVRQAINELESEY